MTSFLPKTNETILRISALLYKAVYNRAEIFKIILLDFGKNNVFIKSFQFLLTFTLQQVKTISMIEFYKKNSKFFLKNN